VPHKTTFKVLKIIHLVFTAKITFFHPVGYWSHMWWFSSFPTIALRLVSLRGASFSPFRVRWTARLSLFRRKTGRTPRSAKRAPSLRSQSPGRRDSSSRGRHRARSEGASHPSGGREAGGFLGARWRAGGVGTKGPSGPVESQCETPLLAN
jgi:hypothetical protein